MAKVQKIEATRDGRTRFFHPVTWDAMKEDPKTGHPHMGYTRVSKDVVIPASVEKAMKAGRPKKEDDVNN